MRSSERTIAEWTALAVLASASSLLACSSTSPLSPGGEGGGGAGAGGTGGNGGSTIPVIACLAPSEDADPPLPSLTRKDLLGAWRLCDGAGFRDGMAGVEFDEDGRWHMLFEDAEGLVVDPRLSGTGYQLAESGYAQLWTVDGLAYWRLDLQRTMEGRLRVAIGSDLGHYVPVARVRRRLPSDGCSPSTDALLIDSSEELREALDGEWALCSGEGPYGADMPDIVGLRVQEDGAWSYLRDMGGRLEAVPELSGDRVEVMDLRASFGPRSFQVNLYWPGGGYNNLGVAVFPDDPPRMFLTNSLPTSDPEGIYIRR